MIKWFVIISGLLVLAVAGLLLTPLIRKRMDGQATSAYAAVATLITLLFGSGALYGLLSNYNWVEAPASADTPAAMTAKLARRLASKPASVEDVSDWLMLARSYEVLDQFPLAIRAYQRVDRLTNGTNVEAIFGIADILVAEDQESISGPAGKLYERALELAPTSHKALFGAGIAALTRGDNALARQRMARILELEPTQDQRRVIERFIASIDARAAGNTAPAAAPAAGGEPPRISVYVTLNPGLASKITRDAALFVAARDPQSPGPPFAVKRLAAKFPVEVVLTPDDAMLATRSITRDHRYDVVARVALGGTPTASSGDPFGQVSYHVGKDGRLNIVIDKLSP